MTTDKKVKSVEQIAKDIAAYSHPLTRDAIEEICLTAFLQRDKEIREEVITTINDLLAQKQKHPCKYETPRGETAHNYDCTDIHIGHEEFARDLIEALTPTNNTN